MQVHALTRHQEWLEVRGLADESPKSVYAFFSGASNILFTFGGHGMLM